jgi:putative peptidoglycan lipid II flippase
MSKRNTESLGRSSGKIGSATAASRVTGLLRETVFAYLLGSGLAADAYFAATRIPNLLRDLFAEGALGAAFVPVVSEKLTQGDRQGAFALTARMLSLMAGLVGIVVVAGIVLAPIIVRSLAPGFAAVPGKIELTTLLVRWTFPYLWLISLSALVAGTLNALHRFGVPASAPILFNVGHIGTAVLFYAVFDPPVLALAVGVTVGAAAQLVFQWPALHRAGFRFRLRSPHRDPDVRRVLKLVLPVVIGLAALQMNNLVTTLVASLLPQGSLSYLNYAFRLMHFPLGVFAVAVGTAVLPRAATAVTRGDAGGLQRTFDEGISLAAFLVLPAAAFLVLFPDVVVSVVYQRGAFTALDTIDTSHALRFYALGLFGYTGVRIAAPIFYAHQNTRTPMRFAMAAVAVNIVLNVAFAVVWGFVGLAAANAVAGTVNFLLLQQRMRRQYAVAPGATARRELLTLATDGLLAGVVTYGVWRAFGGLPGTVDFPQRLLYLFGLGALFLLVYLWRLLVPDSPQRRMLRRLRGS